MHDYLLLLPEIFLAVAICVILLWDLFLQETQKSLNANLSIVALAGTFLLLWHRPEAEPIELLQGSFIVDTLGNTLKMWVLGIVALALFYSTHYLRDRDILKGEYYVLSLFGALGMMVMISSGNMLTAYLGLEMLSLSLYAMVAFQRDNPRSSEAAIKYFVLGALASGILLYGVSLIYGISGSIGFTEINQYLVASAAENSDNNVTLSLGLVCVVVGLAFKFGAVPFHMWLPDVYDGAPLAVTLYLSSAPKIAGFALAIRFLSDGLQPLQFDWQGMLVILAALSLAIGNIVAIAQSNIKRMLAYSTISHVGFLLLGLLAGTADGYAAAMFYALVYAFTSVAGFGLLIFLSRSGFEVQEVSDLSGLSRMNPWFAGIALIVFFSMAGVPPTVGFYAKFAVLNAVIEADLVWLAVYAVIFSVVGAYYYLRAIKVIFFDAPSDNGVLRVSAGVAQRALLSANGLALLGLGIFPSVLMGVCTLAFA